MENLFLTFSSKKARENEKIFYPKENWRIKEAYARATLSSADFFTKNSWKICTNIRENTKVDKWKYHTYGVLVHKQ